MQYDRPMRGKLKASVNRPGITIPGTINGPNPRRKGEPMGTPEEEDEQPVIRKAPGKRDPGKYSTRKRAFPTDKTRKVGRGDTFVMPPNRRKGQSDEKVEAIKRRLQRRKNPNA